MKEKQKKEQGKAAERRWEKLAALYEDPKTSVKMLEQSRALSAAEKKKFLGKSKSKAISIRIPEEDLFALKEVAEKYQRKYQQLIVLAIEQYLEQFPKNRSIK
jgi:predicted DNA binding CopG/RHH family protein